MTLSILDTSSKRPLANIRKTIIIYLVLSFTTIGIDNIYAVFGHGVRSPSMTWMFLYPLIGGTLVYFLIKIFFPWINHFLGYRLFSNLYNSGIATLTVGSFLKGILEIAGTSSPYTILFFVTGWLLTASGIILLAVLAANRQKIGTFLSEGNR